MRSPRILLIHTDAALLEDMVAAFELRLPQALVETSVSVSAVLDQIRAGTYHAIVIDMKMTMVNGSTLLCEIKKVRPWTPIVFMTGSDDDDRVKEAVKAGAYDCIERPVNPELLVLLVKRAIEANRLRDGVRDSALRIEKLPPSVLAGFGKILWAVRRVVDTDEDAKPAAFGGVTFALPAEAEYAKRNLENTTSCEHCEQIEDFLTMEVMNLESCLLSNKMVRTIRVDTPSVHKPSNTSRWGWGHREKPKRRCMGAPRPSQRPTG